MGELFCCGEIFFTIYASTFLSLCCCFWGSFFGISSYDLKNKLETRNEESCKNFLLLEVNIFQFVVFVFLTGHSATRHVLL